MDGKINAYTEVQGGWLKVSSKSTTKYKQPQWGGRLSRAVTNQATDPRGKEIVVQLSSENNI